MGSVVLETRFQMEDPPNVTPMADIHVALHRAGVEALLITAHVLDAQTSG